MALEASQPHTKPVRINGEIVKADQDDTGWDITVRSHTSIYRIRVPSEAVGYLRKPIGLGRMAKVDILLGMPCRAVRIFIE